MYKCTDFVCVGVHTTSANDNDASGVRSLVVVVTVVFAGCRIKKKGSRAAGC